MKRDCPASRIIGSSSGLSTTAQRSQIAGRRPQGCGRARAPGGAAERSSRRAPRRSRRSRERDSSSPHHDHRGEDQAVEHVVPVAQRDEHEEEGREQPIAPDRSWRVQRGADASVGFQLPASAASSPALDRLQQVQREERYPLQADHLHVAQQVRDVERREGEDDARRECRQAARSWPQHVARQQVGAEPAQGEAEQHGRVVGRQQPEGKLDRQGDEAVEGVQRVEQQTDAGGSVEQVGEPGVRVLFEQRRS